MPLAFSADHPTFALKGRIYDINKDFLDAFGFNYFQYLRCFADGSIGLLTNHTGILEYVNQIDNSPVVFSSFSKEYENAQSYWFLWDEALPEMPVQLAREKFNIRNGITLVRRTKHYYDMIAVALPEEQAHPGTFYLNKLKMIEQHIQHFDQNNKDLLDLMHKNPIALPPAYRDVNYQSMCLTKGRINVQGRQGPTYITAQELTCLRLFLQGASYKEIANLLHISNRTVETHLSRVKERTQLRTRSELNTLLTLCP